MTLEDLDQQQTALYKWEYVQHGIVTFLINDDDFDPADNVTDIRYDEVYIRISIFILHHPPHRPDIPWFLACNKDRFPYWFGEADPRNKNLLQALSSGSSPLSMDQRQAMFPYIPRDVPDEKKKLLFRLFFTPADQNGNILLQ